MLRIRDWFFQDSSPYQLAILRVLLASLSFLILFRFLPFSEFHFSDAGWFSRTAPSWFYPAPYGWTPFFWSGDPQFVTGVFYFFIIASLFMIVGLCTPITTPLTWLAILSIRGRNMALTDGTEFILQFALMYLSFTDSGQVLSLDQKFNLREKIWKSVIPYLTRSSWPLRMIQLHLVIIYVVAGTSKTLATQFWDGSFLSIVLMNKNFSRWDFAFLHGSYLAILVSKVITWLIPFWESTFSLFTFHRKTLKFAVISGVLFHLGILAFLKISYFPLAMIACYVAFFPAPAFNWIDKLSFNNKGIFKVEVNMKIVFLFLCLGLSFNQASAKTVYYKALATITESDGKTSQMHSIGQIDIAPKKIQYLDYMYEKLGKPVTKTNNYLQVDSNRSGTIHWIEPQRESFEVNLEYTKDKLTGQNAKFVDFQGRTSRFKSTLTDDKYEYSLKVYGQGGKEVYSMVSKSKFISKDEFEKMQKTIQEAAQKK